MRHLKLAVLILAVAVGWAGGGSLPRIFAQEKTATQKNLSDTELRSFAKAYVEYHKIRGDYESRINRSQDTKERQKLQQEGDAKVTQALQKQGFTIDRSEERRVGKEVE